MSASTPLPDLDRRSLMDQTLEGVIHLWKATEELEERYALTLESVAASARPSARNLIHYLAVRQHDIRALQEELSRLGLSSLGRMEAHVRATLAAVIRALEAMTDCEVPFPLPENDELDFKRGDRLLSRNADAVLGPTAEGALTRIMVTMPSEAADNYPLVRDLIASGMNVARINCAHDDKAAWQRMVDNVEMAAAELKRDCRVAFDLAGPKLRTGPLEPAPPVIRWKPTRDHFGRVESRARICIARPADAGAVFEPGAPTVPVSQEVFDALRPGLRLVLEDARARKRNLDIEAQLESHFIARCDRTGYVIPGTPVYVYEPSEKRRIAWGEIAPFDALPSALRLSPGQTLIVSRLNELGHGPITDEHGVEMEPALIGCDLAEVYRDAEPGEPISFDDGMIEGLIREVHADHLVVEITRTAKLPGKLKAEKGINLPNTDLKIPGLTDKDIDDLDFAARQSSMVSLSFVRERNDVERLIEQLNERHADNTGIILKIETRKGFENLGGLLLAAMSHPPVVVMIARGDLGVELGFERMAEVQEEILWLCEAAHVPVVWATQVLESLAKRGLATRAEVTDAAMGSRAECVMLNKGPHIIRTVQTLSDILRRMATHHTKKTATLRKLSVATLDNL